MGISVMLPRPFVEKRLDETRMRVMVPKPRTTRTQKGWIIENASATGKTYPEWDDAEECYRLPKAHLANFVEESLAEWGRCTVRLEFKNSERCGSACWYAEGDSCTCSCLGKDHGSYGNPGEGIYGGWQEVSSSTTKRGTKIVTYRITR